MNGGQATIEEHLEEQVLFAKISEVVQALLRVEEASVLRKLEGRLSAALTKALTEAEEAAGDESLIERLTVLL